MKASTVINGSRTVAIVSYHPVGDDPVFQSWNHDGFHYIASGRWSEWVALAKEIIAADERDHMKRVNHL